jgi:restriction endonuclease S subunit
MYSHTSKIFAILHEDVTNLLMSNRVFRLGELVQISQGITLSRYRNDEGAQERIVNARNLDQLYIEGDLSIEQLRVSNLAQYQLKTDDVVIAIRGTPIKAAVVTPEVEGSLAGQNLAMLRPKSKDINPLYLAVVLCSKWLERSLATLYGQSSATQLISIAQLRKLQIPIPDLATQNKIAELFLSAERARKITLEALETRQRLTEFTLFQILEEQQ